MIPELPQLPDLAAAVASWLAGEAVKRLGDRTVWGLHVRRLLPLLVVAVGAGVRVACSALIDHTPVATALLRGAIAGGAAVYAQQVRTATVGGDVSAPKATS